MKNKQFNCVELFAGSGGLGTGFSKSGFNIVSANDVWEPAGKTYVANHPNVKYIVKDIAKLTGDELLENTGYSKSDIDVIIGGPPCQGFSTLGKRFIDDPRNKLFKEYVRIVSEIKPKIFVMENVSGILSMEGGKVLENILKSFNDIGYNVEYKLLNAAEYGVPQNRERTIFIGTRLDIKIKYPKKTHSISGEKGYKNALTLWDAISDLPQSDTEEINEYVAESQNEFQTKIRGNCNIITNHKPSVHNGKAINMMKYIPVGKSAWDVKDMPKEFMPTSGYGNTYARLNPNEPGMTITRNFACISSSRCIHPYANRGLTAREAARIQTYPDDYVFKGSKTDIHLQIGNSVPPMLGEKIADKIKEMLEN
jgi:DNA (cytosine-5)-methyltransferase 1